MLGKKLGKQKVVQVSVAETEVSNKEGIKERKKLFMLTKKTKIERGGSD